MNRYLFCNYHRLDIYLMHSFIKYQNIKLTVHFVLVFSVKKLIKILLKNKYKWYRFCKWFIQAASRSHFDLSLKKADKTVKAFKNF